MTEAATVPAARAAGLRAVLERLSGARRVVLTTHVNADADGAGSEAAVAAWLEARGVAVAIVNPTPFPANLRFLLHRPELAQDLGRGGEARLDAADLVLVLDTSEPNRVAPLVERLRPEQTLVVDHHPAGPTVVGTQHVQDPTAAATGEMVFDLITLAGGPWPPESVLGIYVALVSDTGSFRFANTSPRAHLIAADLLGRGVDPESVFQKLYATVPPRRLQLLREALGRLEHDPDVGLSWMVVPASVAERLDAAHEDFEGLVDHARALEGTRVALLFRGLPGGVTKISLRSNGDTDVNRIARHFGGGGHRKAAGATVHAPPDEVVPRVLAAARQALGDEVRGKR